MIAPRRPPRAWRLKNIAVLGLLSSGLLAQQPQVVELECPRGITYRIARDLDGDGLAEFLVVTKKEVWIWKGRRESQSRAPDRKLALPEGTALFDVAHGGIVARTADAYWQLAADGKRTRLAIKSGPGLPRRPTNLVWRGIFFDFDGDGNDEALDVSLKGYRIGFANAPVVLPASLRETIDARANAASERRVARYAFADWARGDFDGDRRADFAVISDAGLIVYPSDENKRFDPGRALEIKLPEAKDSDVSFADWNGDGRTDALAVWRSRGQATLLFARPGTGLRSPRRVRLTVPGYMRFPEVGDFNGDGRPDLALPYINHARDQDLLRIALHQTIILKVPIFLNRGGDNPIPRLADRQLQIPIKFRISADATGKIGISGLFAAEYGGDLTGDGRVDLLVTKASDLLAVHPGVPGAQVFAPEPALTITIPDSGEFDSVKTLAAEINGDKISDIILHYRGRGLRPDRLFVLLSRKK